MIRISWTVGIAAALLVALMLTVACGGGTSVDNADQGEDSATSTSPESNGDSAKDLAPDFEVIVSQGNDILGGDQVAMASLVGEKPVVLNFWAAECPPCRAELPEFQEFHEEYGDRILVLGVDLGQFTNQGTPEQGRELLTELDVHIPAGYTEDSQILPKYRVLGLPTTVFINADGSIHNKWTGALNKETLIEKGEEMLGQ